MKRIIPFVKDLEFGTKITEITSIALEHNLQMENSDSVVGNFTVSGKYKINEISINEEVFEKVIPFDITLDDKYDMSKVQIDIDDFYYEIINDERLRVHIDVLADNLVYEKREEQDAPDVKIEEKHITEPVIEADLERNLMEEVSVKEENEIMVNQDVAPEDNYVCEKKEEGEDLREKIDIANNLSSSFLDGEEKYATYKVHIVRETETIEQIKEMYKVTGEELEKYNNLENIVLGTKIIIPISNE